MNFPYAPTTSYSSPSPNNLYSNFSAQNQPSSIPPKPPDIYALPPEYQYSIAQEAAYYPNFTSQFQYSSSHPELSGGYDSNPYHHPAFHQPQNHSSIRLNQLEVGNSHDNPYCQPTQIFHNTSVQPETIEVQSQFQKYAEASKQREADYQSLRDDMRTLKESMQSAVEYLKQKFSPDQTDSSSRYNNHHLLMYTSQIGGEIIDKSDGNYDYGVDVDNMSDNIGNSELDESNFYYELEAQNDVRRCLLKCLCGLAVQLCMIVS